MFSRQANTGGYSDVADHRCAYGDRAVHYNGNTTMQLVNCLLEAPTGAQLLVITSAGGEVDVAIFAAHIVAEMQLDVEVVGQCASSCANYLLPAARRVHVDPYSVVMVHGGPGPPDRDGLIKALAKIGATPEDPDFEETVAANLLRSTQTHRLHGNFVKKFHSNLGLYEFADVRQAAEEQGLARPYFLLDPYWLKACLPGVEVIADEPDRESLEALVPKRDLLFFSDIRGQRGECTG